MINPTKDDSVHSADSLNTEHLKPSIREAMVLTGSKSRSNQLLQVKQQMLQKLSPTAGLGLFCTNPV